MVETPAPLTNRIDWRIHKRKQNDRFTIKTIHKIPILWPIPIGIQKQIALNCSLIVPHYALLFSVHKTNHTNKVPVQSPEKNEPVVLQLIIKSERDLTVYKKKYKTYV